MTNYICSISGRRDKLIVTTDIVIFDSNIKISRRVSVRRNTDGNSRDARYLSLVSFVMYTAVKVLELLASLPSRVLRSRIRERGAAALSESANRRARTVLTSSNVGAAFERNDRRSVHLNTSHFQPTAG